MNELLDHRPYRTLLIVAFLALAWAPLIGSLLGIGDDVARIELRRAAELPDFPATAEAVRELPGELEEYLDDAFGFRSQLVTANSLLHLAIGVSGSDRYVIGHDGWFFHRTVDNVLAQHRGMETFEGDELDHWIHTMRRRKAWLAKRGIEFLILIAPHKQAIYPEFLPEWVNVVGPTRYEELRARIDGRRAGILDLLDVHEPLRSAKRESEDFLYYKTDGHWNDLGAFVAYQEIARWIRARHPQVPVLERTDFALTWETLGVGTITRGLNILEQRQEPVPTLELRAASHVVSTEKLGAGRDFGYFYVERIRTDLRDRPKVLFIRDSFATKVARFLSETVSETVLSHHTRGGFDRSFIEKHKPDIVIYEMIERGLSWELRRMRR